MLGLLDDHAVSGSNIADGRVVWMRVVEVDAHRDVVGVALKTRIRAFQECGKIQKFIILKFNITLMICEM